MTVLSAGFGIRSELFEAVFDKKPKVGFLEAHSENYFGESIARAKLRECREQYQISLHGVGLSLGRADHLSQHHLDQLKSLIDEIEPLFVSEHLAWSAYSHRHLPDLLPLPLTEQSFVIMCEHISQMQDHLQKQILVENPSNYLLFDQLQIPEPEFLNRLAEKTGCGLLVDVNNIHVSSTNLQRDASEYINQLDTKFIQQYHLAGYTEVEKSGENVLIDTHNHTVYPPVWSLFEHTVQCHGKRPTLIEWDSEFPELEVLLSECEKAEVILNKPTSAIIIQNTGSKVINANTEKTITQSLVIHQNEFLDRVLDFSHELPQAIDEHKHRVWIYQNNVFAAIREYLQEVYPALEGVLGAGFFKQMTQAFIQQYPPSEGNIHKYGQDLSKVLNDFDALSEMHYLKDLIHYEWALHSAYFSPVTDLVEPIKIEQEELLSLPIEFNESVSLLASEYPIYQIHLQSLPDFGENVSIDLGQSKDCLLVYKQQHAVSTRVLMNDEARFFKCLDKSETLLQAIEGVQGSISESKLSASVALVFELGLLSKKI